MGIQKSLTYRVNYVLSMLAAGFPILLQWVFWQAVFDFSQTNQMYGLTYSEMLTYVTLSALLSQALRTGFEYDIAQDIKNGGLNRFLVQPISYAGYRFASFLGNNLTYFICTLILMNISLLLCHLYLGLDLSLSQISLFFPAVILSLVMQFLLFYLVSMMAFWLQEVWGLFESVRIISLVLSGGMVPLTVFGDKAMQWLEFMPFKYIIFFPLQIVIGKLAIAEIMQGMLMQCFWSALLCLVAMLLWKRGQKQFLALG